MKNIIDLVRRLKISPIALVFLLFSASTLFAANAIIYPKYTIGSGDGSGNQATVNSSGQLQVGGSVTANNASVGVNGAAAPTSSTQVGILVGANLQPVSSSNPAPISAASLPLPTGAATSAKQPALGTAGTASSDVLSVQGIASMTPLLVNGSGSTQPISGTVTANQGGTWSTRLQDGTGTPITSTGGALNVSGTITGSTTSGQTALQTTSITNNSTDATLAVSGYSNVTTCITGTYNTYAGQFQISLDGGVTYPGVIQSTRTDTQTIESTTGNLTNITRCWNTSAAGATNFRLHTTALTSGTATVTQIASSDDLSYIPVAGLSGVNGTAFTTAGFVDIKGADGNVFVRQATASNLNAQAQGAAASGASKSGNPVQVGGVFNTTQPTVTTGQAVEAQATARGAHIVAVGVDNFPVNGVAANNATQSGNPLSVGATAINAAPTVATNGQAAQLNADLEHYLLMRPWANKENIVSGCANITTATNTSLIAAQGAGVKIYMLGFSVSNSGSTTDQLDFTSASGGTRLWSTINPTGGGSNFSLPEPVVTGANAALFVTTAQASTTEKICAVGYIGS